ncbi:MAG TPA: histidine--tRNA ligase [Alphaproteobacteria bacterium]|nr:histidine--tRNA ligase [Alphaproteobacteria bacterium]
MSSKLVSPLTGAASGFPEYTPAQQRAFEAAVAIIKGVYESFGFTPLETSAVEKLDTLESKGISAKEVYGIRRLNVAEGEDGGKDLALRFDLTVPTARYVVANQGALTFPFRRYQVQPVWRGERAQAGRYRQFYQFDIDTIGDGSLPLVADAEVLAAGFKALEALGVGDFTMRINNRKLLQGLLEWAGLGAHQQAAIKLIDDAEKVGWDKTADGLRDLNGKAKVSQLVELLQGAGPDELGELDLNGDGKLGLDELTEVMNLATRMVGKSNAELKVDLTIARGLDYYTGTVVETTLHGAPELGSIMSGGRYEDLAASLGKKKMPGVGISIGLSRLMAYLLSLHHYAKLAAAPADVLVAVADEDALPAMAELAQKLRDVGVKAELAFPAKGLGQQLQAAEKRGLQWAVVGMEGDKLKLRNFASRADTLVALADVKAAIQ